MPASTSPRNTELIPRQVLFGNPDRARAQVSPDGQFLSYLAADAGVLNVWVAPLSQPAEARVVTQDRVRGIRQYAWAYTNEHIVYIQDQGGDENWRVYVVELASGQTRDLTPLDGVQARIEAVSPNFPEEIIIGLNDRQAELHDLYRINIRTGERTAIYENEGFIGFEIDDDYALRLAIAPRPDGGQEIVQRTGDAWEPFISVEPDDALTTGPIGFGKSGKTLYLIDSRDRDTAGLVARDMASGEQTVLISDERADVSDVWRHPTERRVQAAAVNYDRRRWTLLDDALADDLERLRSACSGEIDIASRSLDDQQWIVTDRRADGPTHYYHYDRSTASPTLNFLFVGKETLRERPLAEMRAELIPARDGLELVSYLSLPRDADDAGRPPHPLPLVLLVHGGPWARDEWGFEPEHQWLTDRGYAALSVNYRGSTGFGKRFLNAGNREWAGKMHDDLLDAVKWAVDAGIADPGRVAIMGGSYGGYATLVGLAFTPEVFACGVDIVGISSLITLLESVPPYWKPLLDLYTARVGDHRTDEGRDFLWSRSPLSRVDEIKRPLLIGQGANDPRVKQQESDQIVHAMQEKHLPVTYVLYPDEGHGFARPENRLSFYAVAEAFLAQHLGGACEPVGADFANASIEIPTGSDQIPGVAAALQE